MVLMLTFIIIITLTAIVAAFLYLTSAQLKGPGYDAASRKALWIAEAGIQKAIWCLATPVGSGGLGGNWTTPPLLTEDFGGGSYTVAVTAYDFALASNGATVTASTNSSGNPPENVNDGNDSTFWESAAVPSSATPQTVTILFPYALGIIQAGFLAPNSTYAPLAYTWQVSTDGTNYTTVYTCTNYSTGNMKTDVFTPTPPLRTGVNYLRLNITSTQGGGSLVVRVRTISVIGRKITSTGTIGGINRKIERTVVVKESTQTGYGYAENDWKDKGSL